MFSASTCLTYNGTTTLGPNIEIYSNYDSYSTLIDTVLLTDITPPNCPYILLLPNGTTIVELYDPISNCACYIPVNNLCESCDISFSQYSSDTVSLISVGNVTGSCDPSITDYKITWYGPGVGSTTVAFTSGSGATFAPYDYVHPLTGTSAVLVEEGIYTPVLETIEINGTIFSNTGGTGTIYASLDCLTGTNVNVTAFTCDNGVMVDNYIHSINFLNAGGGNFPQPMSATFRLSSAVKYFAWKFKGFTVPDTLKLTFSGTNYIDPIYLEYFDVGSTTSTNFNDNVWPKSATTSGYLSKVTCLTGFTITDDDFITIEITPNISNLQTNFSLSCTCLFDFNCDTCIENNTPYKIVSADTTYNFFPGACYDTIQPILVLSGCSYNDNRSYDLLNYYQSDGYTLFGFPPFRYIDCDNVTNKLSVLTTPQYLYYNNYDTCGKSGPAIGPITPVCDVVGVGTITFSKTIPLTEGLIELTFTQLSDLQNYVDSYDVISAYSGTPTNSSLVDYYRFYKLSIPSGSTCGDGTIPITYYIHPSSVVTTGVTLGIYTMTITMPTINNDLTWDSCDINCLFFTNSIVNQINASSTATTNNYSFTSFTSSMYTVPFNNPEALNFGDGASSTASTVNGYYSVNYNLNENHPSSGISYTLIPSLSSVTCSDISQKMVFNNNLANIWFQYAFAYKIVLTDPLDVTSFTIYASPITNGEPLGFNPFTSPFNSLGWTYSDTALIFSAGTITYCNPLYVV